MKIIVESGATKSSWLLLNQDGQIAASHEFPGMNVSAMSMDAVRGVLSEALGTIGCSALDGLYIYTAGVVTPAIREDVISHIRSLAEVSDVDVQNDLVGAARSVCGHSEGIAAIMGTGSNTCFYDGHEIHQEVMSGGYVIGDDGSAAALGKLFLSDLIKNLVPEEIAKDFASRFDASYQGIVEGVYRSQSPSAYLGSLAPFIVSHYDNPYVKALVDRNFQAFIDRSLLRYDVANYPVGVVGGFGYACRDIFLPLCDKAGIRISGFVPRPIDGLVQYHIGR